MKIVALQLDLGRQKENIPFIKSMADFAVKYGYNTIMLYLENCVRTDKTEFFNKEETYSVSEMQEIVSYMEKKGLDVIPAFENLGHLEKFLDYDELGEFSETQDCSKEGRGWWYPKHIRGQNGCVSNKKLSEFMDNYVKDVSKIFHSKYIHMGLDEIFDFAICPRCKKRIKNGETKDEMFYKHVLHCYELVKSLGKTMMMWDDFFEYFNIIERLPKDIVMCTWDYYFIGDELAGHWTNRVKRDPFRDYDRLGFKYLYCTYAHNAGSTYNVDGFYDYSRKFNPIGTMMTSWERASSFYQGQLPIIAYASQKELGKIKSHKDAVKLYTSLLGGEKEIAELLLSMQIPIFMDGYQNVTFQSESDYLIKSAMRGEYRYVLNKIEEGLKRVKGTAKDILTDIYDYILGLYLSLTTQKLGIDAFNRYEMKIDTLDLVPTAKGVLAGYKKIKKNGEELWKKYRKGIKSCGNAFNSENEWKIKSTQDLIEKLSEKKDVGILYFDAMMHDAYSTVKAEIRIKYKGEKKETFIYKGAIKPSIACFEVGACYGFRFAIKNKKVDYAVLEVYGEGALWPLNLRYAVNKVKYQPKKIEVISGNVKDKDAMLFNDTNFATLGYNNGKEHLINEKLWRKKSGVKIYF